MLVVSGVFGFAIWANQDSQKARCIGYELSGVHKDAFWTVTCFANGHDQGTRSTGSAPCDL